MRRHLRFCIIVGLISLSSLFAFAQEDSLIRVRLETRLMDFSLQATGAQFATQNSPITPVAIPRNNQVSIRREKLGKGIVWVVSRNNNQEIFTDKYLAMKAYEPRKGAKLYPSQLLFTAKANSLYFDVIGILPIENYLIGVLASEMPLSWPVEALKAQAIAARSYAMAVMRERGERDFHVESSILDQVFTHISQGADESPLIAKAKEAVQSTQGQILTAHNGKVIKAFYHSDCGGKTVQATSVWGYGTNTGVATDSYCPANPRAHWNFKISDKDFVAKMRRVLKKSFAAIYDLQLVRISPQERVSKIRFKDEQGKEHSLLGNQLREVLGYNELKSTWFQLSRTTEGYMFQGQGYGHGVGLCQWGSRAMASSGKNYLQIVKHYYPAARLENSKIPTAGLGKMTASY